MVFLALAILRQISWLVADVHGWFTGNCKPQNATGFSSVRSEVLSALVAKGGRRLGCGRMDHINADCEQEIKL